MIEANTADVFNVRVHIKQIENNLPANTVISLKVEEANLIAGNIASNSVLLSFGGPNSNNLIDEVRTITYTVTNSTTQFVKASLEISNNYSGAEFDNKIRFWNMSINKGWAVQGNVTTIPVFPTTILLPKPQVNYWNFPTPAIRATDEITITSPTVVNEIADNQLFYIKGLVPVYTHRGSGYHKIAFAWEGEDYTGVVPNNAIIMYARSVANNLTIEAWANGVNVGKSPNIIVGTDGKFSVAFTANTTQMRWSYNGDAVGTNNYSSAASWTSGALSSIKLGRSNRAVNTALGGTIKVFQFERRSATDEELIELAANVG